MLLDLIFSDYLDLMISDSPLLRVETRNREQVNEDDRCSNNVSCTKIFYSLSSYRT